MNIPPNFGSKVNMCKVSTVVDAAQNEQLYVNV